MKKVFLLLIIFTVGLFFCAILKSNAYVQYADPDLEPMVDDFSDALIMTNNSDLYVITDDGKVYTRHTNTASGPKEIDLSHFDTVFEEGEHFVQFTGTYHVFVGLTNKGNIYTWGTYYYGCLGDGQVEYEWAPPCIGCGGGVDPLEFYREIEDVHKFTDTYLKIDGYHNSFLAINSDGELIGWGDTGFKGKIGHESDISETPTTIIGTEDLDSGEKIVDFESNGSNVIVLTSNNRILTFGYTGDGLVGNDEIKIDKSADKDDYMLNPLNDDDFHVLDIPLTENDVVTDIFIDDFASVIINDEDIYIWGKVHSYITEDFRLANQDNIEYLDGETDRIYNERVVRPTSFNIEGMTNVKRILQSGSYQLLAFNDETVTYLGEYYSKVDLYPKNINLDNIEINGSFPVFTVNDDKGLHEVGFAYRNYNKLNLKYNTVAITNNFKIKNLNLKLPALENPTGSDYFFIIAVYEKESGDSVYTTRANSDLEVLEINDDNPAIETNPLKVDTEYVVEYYLFYNIDGEEVGPFPFISEEVKTMPPLGEATVDAYIVGEDIDFLGLYDEPYSGYQVDIKYNQSFYEYSNWNSNLIFELYTESTLEDCDTTYVDGLCRVVDDSIKYHILNAYNNDDTWTRKYSYKMREHIESSNVPSETSVYFTGLDDDINYTVRVSMNSPYFGNLVNPDEPSEGKDGYLGSFDIIHDLDKKNEPTISVGDIEFIDNNIIVPVNSIEDTDGAIVWNELYIDLCQDDVCETYEYSADLPELRVDNLAVGLYTAEVYAYVNTLDNKGNIKEVLKTTEISVDNAMVSLTLGDVVRDGNDISIDIELFEDVDNVLLDGLIKADLCNDSGCTNFDFSKDADTMTFDDVAYGSYTLKVYAYVNLNGSQNKDVEITVIDINHYLDMPTIELGNPVINGKEVVIPITSITDTESTIQDNELLVNVCYDTCTTSTISSDSNEITISDLEVGNVVIKISVSVNNGAEIIEYQLSEDIDITVIKEEPTVSLGAIVKDKDSITIPVDSIVDTDDAIVDSKIYLEYCLEGSCETEDFNVNSNELNINNLSEGQYTIKVYMNVDLEDGEGAAEEVILTETVTIESSSLLTTIIIIAGSVVALGVAVFGVKKFLTK